MRMHQRKSRGNCGGVKIRDWRLIMSMSCMERSASFLCCLLREWADVKVYKFDDSLGGDSAT